MESGLKTACCCHLRALSGLVELSMGAQEFFDFQPCEQAPADPWATYHAMRAKAGKQGSRPQSMTPPSIAHLVCLPKPEVNADFGGRAQIRVNMDVDIDVDINIDIDRYRCSCRCRYNIEDFPCPKL